MGRSPPLFPQPTACLVKKSVRTYTHTDFLFTHLNLPISPASLVSCFLAAGIFVAHSLFVIFVIFVILDADSVTPFALENDVPCSVSAKSRENAVAACFVVPPGALVLHPVDQFCHVGWVDSAIEHDRAAQNSKTSASPVPVQMPFVNAAVAAFHCRFSPHTVKTEFLFQKRSVVRVTQIGCHSCCRIRWILLHCIPPHHHKTFQFSDFTLNGEKKSIHCVIVYTCHKNWKRIFRYRRFYFSQWREKKC